MSANSSIINSTQNRALDFIIKMFQDRKYVVKNKELLFNIENHFYYIEGFHKTVGKVLCVLGPDQSISHGVDLFDFVNMIEINRLLNQKNTSETNVQNIKTTIASNSYMGHKKNKTGIDFVKMIVTYCQVNEYKILILITDYITPHVFKHISRIESVKITHFTYNEVCIGCIAKHKDQPINFKALSPVEAQEYKKKHPLYEKELPMYSIDDPLVKYFGYKIGDIISITDNDVQSGLVIEYGIVVENHNNF
jgi:DNA-directed RNA polymerase subunit H (RpoH/RPB5)